MKISDLLNEVLEEDQKFRDLNKVQKLAAKTVIKRSLGKNNIDVPDSDVEMVRENMRTVIAGMPDLVE